MQTWIQSLGREDPLEKEVATHSSILAWEIPWMEEPGRLQSRGLKRVRWDLAPKQQNLYVLMWSNRAILCHHFHESKRGVSACSRMRSGLGLGVYFYFFFLMSF